MPRYFYECSKCGSQFKTVHGMHETQDHCEICFSNTATLRRIPQLTTTQKPPSKEGQRVKQAIEDNKEIFKEMQEKIRGEDYER